MKKRLYSGISAIMTAMVVAAVFDMNTNVTTDAGMSVEMKTYYDKTLIENAEPMLVHDRLAQKRNIPKGNGKTIEFRKYSPFPKALTPLVEGVTPNGRKMDVTNLTATVSQYGDYVTLSDVLILTAIDNNMLEAYTLLGSQAGRTLDTITREVINGGSNVQYGNGTKTGRHLLVGGEASGNDYLTVVAVRKAVRFLKTMNTPKYEGSYWAIIHPDTAYDIMSDPDWQKPHQYVDTANIYDDEIGRIAGVRFMETTEAKIFHADDLTVKDGTDLGYRTLTVASVSTKTFTVDEKITTAQATALVGRKVVIKGVLYTVASAAAGAAGAATITVAETVSGSPGDGDVVYPGEAGAKGRDVYSTLFMGANAYGTTEVEGGGLTTITKQLGSAGTGDPLNQRATCGWKAIKTAVRLVEAYMIRVETASTFDEGVAN